MLDMTEHRLKFESLATIMPLMYFDLTVLLASSFCAAAVLSSVLPFLEGAPITVDASLSIIPRICDVFEPACYVNKMSRELIV